MDLHLIFYLARNFLSFSFFLPSSWRALAINSKDIRQNDCVHFRLMKNSTSLGGSIEGEHELENKP